LSDIAIRLDGLLLGLVIVAGGGIFVVAALLSAIRTLLTKPADKRSWTITSDSLWLVLAHAVTLVLLAAYTDSQTSAPTGPDWIDWLAVPWLCFVLAGLVLLVRRLRRENKPDVG
jgi:cytochrome bd-type quinol oxidase subunit 2